MRRTVGTDRVDQEPLHAVQAQATDSSCLPVTSKSNATHWPSFYILEIGGILQWQKICYLPVEGMHPPHLRHWVWGSAVRSPAGSGGARPPSAFWGENKAFRCINFLPITDVKSCNWQQSRLPTTSTILEQNRIRVRLVFVFKWSVYRFNKRQSCTFVCRKSSHSSSFRKNGQSASWWNVSQNAEKTGQNTGSPGKYGMAGNLSLK